MYIGSICPECRCAEEKEWNVITTDEAAAIAEVPFRPMVSRRVADKEAYYANICQHGRDFGIDFTADMAARSVIAKICISGQKSGAICYRCRELQHLRLQYRTHKGALPLVTWSISAIRRALFGKCKKVADNWWPDESQRAALRYTDSAPAEGPK